MAGLLDSIKDLAKQQYAKGAPYREAVGGLFQGDMNRVNQALSKSDLTPMDFAMMLGTIKGVGKAPLSALEQTILEKSGDSALQRFQKAKSLVPDLETQYTPKALQDLFTQTEKFGLTVMKPSEFENFASPLNQEYKSSPQFLSKIKDLQNIANTTGFNEVPHLHLNKYDSEPVITSHEGRHRTTAFAASGDNPTLVEIMPRYSMYEKVNPNFNMNQKQFINAINKEMALNPNIRPQPEFINDIEKSRLPRKLPNEIFGAALLPAGLLDEKKRK